MASRPLSTTEELEKLEQSITLTLQGRLSLDCLADQKIGMLTVQKSTTTLAGHTAS